MAKKALPCQNTDRTHRSNSIAERSKSKLCMQQSEQLEVRCLAQGSHLSRGQFLPEPRFEPTTSGYKSDALSIRATTAHLEPRLPTCRGSTCAHWHPSSWWRSRRPPSLPMPRNGTAYAFESLSRFYGVIQWSSAQHRFEWTNKHVFASLWSFYINPTFSRIMNWIMYLLLVKLLWMI